MARKRRKKTTKAANRSGAMRREKIHIDKAISSKLEQLEPAFNPEHWAALEKELDKRETGFWFVWTAFISFYSKFKTLIMTTVLSTILAVSVALFGGKDAIEKAEVKPMATALETTENYSYKTPLEQETVPAENVNVPKDTSRNKKITSVLNTLVAAAENEGIIQISNAAVELLSNEVGLDLERNDPPDSSILELVKDGVERKLVKKVWVPEEYERVRIPHEGPISGGWMGLHYTQMQLEDSLRPTTHGFNIQFMSKNLLPSKHIGFYAGFDYGLQITGRGDRREVILNTVVEDLGYTYLSSNTHDFLLRGHLELHSKYLMPYVTGAFGPRASFTGQKVGMYNPPIETEGTSRSNVHGTANLLWNAGVGTRIRITDYMSLDARYEWTGGNASNVVDLDNSTLATTSFNLRYKDRSNTQNAFKIGVVFDLSSSDYEERKVKDGYYKEEVQSYFVDPENEDKIIVPCDCTPCDDRSYNRYEDDDDFRFNRGGGWNSGGSGGGGGRGGMPDIKGPVIRH
jgi:opacity protein-like surface antigen